MGSDGVPAAHTAPRPTFQRPPPRPGRPSCTRGAGSEVRHRHRPRSSAGQGEAGAQPARAGPRCRAVSGAGTRAWRRSGCAALSALLGTPSVVGSTPGTGLGSRGTPRLRFRFCPPASSFGAEKLRGSFLGLLAPPWFSAPSSWLGSPSQPCRGGGSGSRGVEPEGATAPLGTDSPRHVTLPPPANRLAPRTMLLPRGRERRSLAPQPAQHPGLRRQVDTPGQLLRLFYCTVLVCSKEIAALTDFSGYLTKLLQNHTAYACDGDHLNLQCPRHSTISVQSAFYGQDDRMCNSQQPVSQRKDSRHCVASTTLQKVLDECQNQRACHLLVNSRVFGPDLCPGSSKYLLVSFKCQPNEFKNKTVCEGQELKLHCHESKFLNIYSATYGRRTQERDVCSWDMERLSPVDCLSYSPLQVLSQRCYGKQRCRVVVDNHHFGNPCLPGVKKYLTVTYACVPKNILIAIDPAVATLEPSLEKKNGMNVDPSESRVLRKDGVMVSNSLAAFAYIRAHPERAALLFMSSVCVGLALTMCALVVRISCTKDLRELQLGRERLVPGSDKAEEDSEDKDEEEGSSDSDFPGELSGFCRTSYPVYSSIEAAELAERIERREQIIQEIWMNSGLDSSLPRNMSQFY